MKFLFDQNISHRILKLIPAKYSDSTTVKKEGLINEPDREIWEYAKSKDHETFPHLFQLSIGNSNNYVPLYKEQNYAVKYYIFSGQA